MCDPGDTGTLGKQVNEWLDSELSPCLPARTLDEAAVFQTVALCKPLLAKESSSISAGHGAAPGDQHWVRVSVSRRLWAQRRSRLGKLEGGTCGVRRATAAAWASCRACWVAFDITLPTPISLCVYISLGLFPSLPLPSTLWPAFFLPPPFSSLKKKFFLMKYSFSGTFFLLKICPCWHW